MSDDSNKHMVFVYGSLKQGFWNNDLLIGSDFIGQGVTLDANYRMISLGGFPGVKHDGECSIAGELYCVNDEVFARLDRLESNGYMYQRVETEVVDQDGELYSAWMYIFLLDDRGRGFSDQIDISDSGLGFSVLNWKSDGRRYV